MPHLQLRVENGYRNAVVRDVVENRVRARVDGSAPLVRHGFPRRP